MIWDDISPFQKLLTDGEYILWEGRAVAQVHAALERRWARNFCVAMVATVLIVLVMLTTIRDWRGFVVGMVLLYPFAMWTLVLSGKPPAPDEPFRYWYAVTNHRVLADMTDTVEDTLELPLPLSREASISQITETVGTVNFPKGIRFYCVENPEAVLAALERAAFLSEGAHRR